MKKKVLVTYSAKYIKEVELEVTEEINEMLDEGRVIDFNKYDGYYTTLESLNQDVLWDLPIPTMCVDEQSEQLVEYIDGSFEIESFEL
jgi:hypothetical protein